MEFVLVEFKGDKSSIRHLANVMPQINNGIVPFGAPIAKTPTTLLQLFRAEPGCSKAMIAEVVTPRFYPGTSVDIEIVDTYNSQRVHEALSGAITDRSIDALIQPRDTRIAELEAARIEDARKYKAQHEQDMLAQREITGNMQSLETRISGAARALERSGLDLEATKSEAVRLRRLYDDAQAQIAGLTSAVPENITAVGRKLVEKAGPDFAKYDVLEELVGKVIDIKAALDTGKGALYELVNLRLGRAFASDSELPSGYPSFEQTEFGAANAATYNRLPELFDTIKKVRENAELLSIPVNLDELSAKENSLTQLKKEYEGRKSAHEEQATMARQILEIKSEHDLARKLVEFKSGMPAQIPVPVLVTHDEGRTQVILPTGYIGDNLQKYLATQFTLKSAGTALYALDDPMATFSKIGCAKDWKLAELGFEIKPKLILD